MNYADVIGPIKDNKQSVTIVKRYQGSGQTVITTPEKVDEYVSNHKKACSNDNKRLCIFGGTGGVLGAAAGLIYNAVCKQKSAGMLGAVGACLGAAAGFFATALVKSSESKVVEEFINNNK